MTKEYLNSVLTYNEPSTTITASNWYDIAIYKGATCGSVCSTTKAAEKSEPEKEVAPKDANNLLVSIDKKLKVKNCKDGFVKNTISIMPDIKDITVKYNVEHNTVIFVTFTDGKVEKAILDKDDEFSLEQGLTIIMLEKLLSDKGVDGKSVHNKLIKYAMKFYDRQEAAKDKEAKRKVEAKVNIERIKERNRKKKLKKANADREYQIEIQKEAYIRAMKAMAKESE